jgi:hypothetical protein
MPCRSLARRWVDALGGAALALSGFAMAEVTLEMRERGAVAIKGRAGSMVAARAAIVGAEVIFG